MIEEFLIDRKKLEQQLYRYRNCEVDVVKWEDVLPLCKADIQPPSRIEAAIRELDLGMLFDGVADFGRWVLGQPQDTWTDKDFGLVPTEEGLEPEGACPERTRRAEEEK